MIFILLSILCSVIIANMLMAFDRNGKPNMLPIFLGNYFLASIFSFLSIPANSAPPGVFDLLLGIGAGALFLANFFVFQKSIAANGLSLSVSVMRIAMIIPILLSLLLFGDSVNRWNVFGIVIALSAFLLKSDLRGYHTIFWLLALFLVSGLTDSTLKLFKELGSGAEPVFIFIIFTAAFFFTLGVIMFKKLPVPLLSLVFGFLLGIPNRLSTVFFLKGLDTVSAAIAYPLTAIGVVMFSIISDTLIWKRRVTMREGIMYALLALSILLLNL
ncbi:MAG: hypothetical protein U1B83_10075 [Candidatus Cloacimonadaceae bacterium]|nr:hypothetical protein [Candidatus Cloacimonadaceae bacterium]